MATTVIGYVRVSTEEQAGEGVSLLAQEAKLRAYCQALDLELVRVEIDAGVSARSLARPGLQRALGSLKRGEVSGLLVTKLDRLTRSVRDLSELLDLFADGKRSLLSVGDSIDTRSAAGRLVLHVLTSVAQWEREAISERTTAALDHLKSQGKRVSRFAPYGYRFVNDTIVVDDAEQILVGRARDLVAAGLSYAAVARTLNESGSTNRAGGGFTAGSVAKMVRKRE